jgi:ureidoacrylate peracid hydrolase
MKPEPRTALLAELMQNDNVERDGAYARHGLAPDGIERILPNLRWVWEECRRRQIPIIATRLTILTDLDGRPMGHDVLASYRPFFRDEGFREGTWGHELSKQLPPPDYEVRKWAFSSFYQTELELLLRSLGVTHVVFVGEATHIAVESTAREARIRGFDVTILSDCVMSYDLEFHESSLVTMSDIFTVIPAAEFLARLE